MGTITYPIPVSGSTLNSVADPEVATALQTLLTWANGNIDAVNLSAALAQSLGANQGGQTTKGATSIAATESTSSTTYTTLTTPDQVTGIVLPANGRLLVGYQATWQESNFGAARAAIFIGTNQLKVAMQSTHAPQTQAAATNSGSIAGKNIPLFSSPEGLLSGTVDATNYGGDVTTGQALGIALGENVVHEVNGAVSTFATTLPAPTGICNIFAAAGTYTVSVQFKASAGSVTASNRKLWVQALGFS